MVYGQMELVVGKNTYSVPESWIKRWQLLSDYQSEYGNRMEWEFDQEQVKLWISLNEELDAGRERMTQMVEVDTGSEEVIEAAFSRRAYQNIIPLLSMYGIIQQMNPIDGEYLLGCRIDETLPHAIRKQLYKELGHYIRKNRLYFSYRVISSNMRSNIGSHRNMGIYRDPVLYAMMAEEGGPLVEHLLAYPYDILVGILHAASQDQAEPMRCKWLEWSISLRRVKDVELAEIPWWLIRLDDIKSMYLTEQVSDQFAEAAKQYQVYYDTAKDEALDTSYIIPSPILFAAAPLEESPIISILLQTRMTTKLYVDDTLVTASEGCLPLVTIAPDPEESFSRPPVLPSPLGDADTYFSLLAQQADLVNDIMLFPLCSDIFGLGRILRRRDVRRMYVEDDMIHAPYRLARSPTNAYAGNGVQVGSDRIVRYEETEAASGFIALWMAREITYTYRTRVVPVADYPLLMKKLLSVTNRDFVNGIATLLIRMSEDTVKNKKWSNREVIALAEAAIAALE